MTSNWMLRAWSAVRWGERAKSFRLGMREGSARTVVAWDVEVIREMRERKRWFIDMSLRQPIRWSTWSTLTLSNPCQARTSVKRLYPILVASPRASKYSSSFDKQFNP